MSKSINFEDLESMLPEGLSFLQTADMDIKPQVPVNKFVRFFRAVGNCEPKEKVIVMGVIVTGLILAGLPAAKTSDPLLLTLKGAGAFAAIGGMLYMIAAKLSGTATDNAKK